MNHAKELLRGLWVATKLKCCNEVKTGAVPRQKT